MKALDGKNLSRLDKIENEVFDRVCNQFFDNELKLIEIPTAPQLGAVMRTEIVRETVKELERQIDEGSIVFDDDVKARYCEWVKKLPLWDLL